MKTTAAVAASLPGYTPDDLRAADAQAFLQRFVSPVGGSEELGLLDALSRVLARDIVSPIDVPPHDNSAMDGYAFDGTQLQPGRPLRLVPLAGSALAGTPWRGTVAPGQCLRTMTGAVMPSGTDTVAPRELTTTATDGSIAIPADALQRGAHRRPRGEDLPRGGVALPKGELLTPAALGLVASLGMEKIPVVRRLRVALLSTGSEILNPGEAPREGAVYDSNRYTLHGLLARLGVGVIDLGAVADDPPQLREALLRGARQADVLITSGGASMGEADHTRSLMQELGDIAFWHIAMRPGRPMVVGRLHTRFGTKNGGSSHQASGDSCEANSILFGLPGNPVAAMVAFIVFVRPALLRMMGCSRAAPPLLRAASTELLRKRPGRTEYQRGRVHAAPDGSLRVCTTGHQGSGVLRSMAQANGLIVLPHDRGDVQPGETVDVMMFEGVI